MAPARKPLKEQIGNRMGLWRQARELKHDDPQVRIAAIQKIQKMGKTMEPRAAEHLVKVLLGDKHEHVRWHAADVLIKMGGSAEKQLEDARTGGASPAQRNRLSQVLEAIHRKGTIAPEVEKHLWGLEHPDEAVRQEAVAALGDIMHKDAIPHLGRMINDRSQDVSEQAFNALDKRGMGSLEHIVKALGHEDGYIRYRAVQALDKMDHPDTFPHLVRALGDKDKGVRGQAIKAIGELDHPEAEKHLNNALKDREHNVRLAAARGLAGRGVIQPLIGLLETPNGQAGNDVVGALRAVDHPDVEPMLIKAVEDKNPYVRYRAMRTLQERKYFERPEAMPLLLKALSNPSKEVQTIAAVAINNRPEAKATQEYQLLLIREKSERENEARRTDERDQKMIEERQVKEKTEQDDGNDEGDYYARAHKRHQRVSKKNREKNRYRLVQRVPGIIGLRKGK